jgi:demethylmenaquinone methyltransferase / 2-methoxy-6-polyprenyl-1,4-benzoquinol methylase
MFDQIAGRYDFLNHFLSCGIDISWRRKAVRAIRPTPDMELLDVCTGTGDLALALWKASGRQARVVGTDFSEKMLEAGRRKVERRSAKDQVELLEADTLALPFEDDRFDAVSVAFGLRNVGDTLGGLREMTRVCKPGGLVVVLEFSMPTIWLIGPIYRWYFLRVLPRLGQIVSRSPESAYEYLPESVSEFPQGIELTSLMEEAGLTETSFRPLTFGIASLYVSRKPEA